MRVFSALFPPDEVVEDFARAVAPLQRAFPGLDWAPPLLWHMRLSFFGNLSHEDSARLSRVLDVFGREQAPFQVCIDGAGATPELTEGQTLYAKLETPDNALLDLYLGSIAAVQSFGWVLDRRSFRPSLPLAHSERPVDFSELVQRVSEYQSKVWEVTSIATVWARPGDDGMPYFELLGEHLLLGERPASAALPLRGNRIGTRMQPAEPKLSRVAAITLQPAPPKTARVPALASWAGKLKLLGTSVLALRPAEPDLSDAGPREPEPSLAPVAAPHEPSVAPDAAPSAVVPVAASREPEPAVGQDDAPWAVVNQDDAPWAVVPDAAPRESEPAAEQDDAPWAVVPNAAPWAVVPNDAPWAVVPDAAPLAVVPEPMPAAPQEPEMPAAAPREPEQPRAVLPDAAPWTIVPDPLAAPHSAVERGQSTTATLAVRGEELVAPAPSPEEKTEPPPAPAASARTVASDECPPVTVDW